MENKFKWGIIGPGRIAHVFMKGLEVIDNAELYAVASRNAERGRSFADHYGGAVIYDEYQELADDPQVDGIYIATPHRFHYEQIKMCLESGKPVLCEKPLTVNAEETQELIELSKRKSVFLMEAMWTRYLPIYQQVREWLDENKIGDISLMTSTFGFKAEKDMDDRWFNHELAGGSLLDIGIYNISVSQWVKQTNPVEVSVSSRIGKTNVDESTSANLVYQDGTVSQFTCTLLADTTNDFKIYGSDGCIHIHPSFWFSTEASLEVGDKTITVTRPARASGFEYEIEEAISCIQGGLLESPAMTHQDTLGNMELMDKIRKMIGLRYSFE